jgi:hypothetical protein
MSSKKYGRVTKYRRSVFEELPSAPRGLIDEVIKSIKASPNKGKLDVRGSMGFSGNLLRLDTLTFADRSVLVLENVEADYVAIAARDLVLDIKNPQYRAAISRLVGEAEEKLFALKLDGKPGTTGFSPPYKHGYIDGKNGLPGDPGGPGGGGGNGEVQKIPPFFFFVQTISFGEYGNFGEQFFDFHFNGLRGGNGGDGGRGGNGAQGSRGKQGIDQAFDCKHGPGNGGDGGTAGPGGRGGNAANGGPGGTITLLAPRANLFNFTTAYIEAGIAGIPGKGGDCGLRGPAGDGGASNGHCHAGNDGSIGK